MYAASLIPVAGNSGSSGFLDFEEEVPLDSDLVIEDGPDHELHRCLQSDCCNEGFVWRSHCAVYDDLKDDQAGFCHIDLRTPTLGVVARFHFAEQAGEVTCELVQSFAEENVNVAFSAAGPKVFRCFGFWSFFSEDSFQEF